MLASSIVMPTKKRTLPYSDECECSRSLYCNFEMPSSSVCTFFLSTFFLRENVQTELEGVSKLRLLSYHYHLPPFHPTIDNGERQFLITSMVHSFSRIILLLYYLMEPLAHRGLTQVFERGFALIFILILVRCVLLWLLLYGSSALGLWTLQVYSSVGMQVDMKPCGIAYYCKICPCCIKNRYLRSSWFPSVMRR